MVRVILAPLWEFWNLSKGDYTFFGVLFLLFGAYGLGFAQGRFPDRAGQGWGGLPGWVQLAVAAFIAGVVIVLAANATDCLPGECEPGP